MGDSMRYLTSSNQAAIIAAQAKISLNCNFPNTKGTIRWAVPQQSVDGSIWFILEPEGYGGFTKGQMMQDVNLSLITSQERNDAWFPQNNGNM